VTRACALTHLAIDDRPKHSAIKMRVVASFLLIAATACQNLQGCIQQQRWKVKLDSYIIKARPRSTTASCTSLLSCYSKTSAVILHWQFSIGDWNLEFSRLQLRHVLFTRVGHQASRFQFLGCYKSFGVLHKVAVESSRGHM
jgi:hypothetical protein